MSAPSLSPSPRVVGALEVHEPRVRPTTSRPLIQPDRSGAACLDRSLRAHRADARFCSPSCRREHARLSSSLAAPSPLPLPDPRDSHATSP